MARTTNHAIVWKRETRLQLLSQKKEKPQIKLKTRSQLQTPTTRRHRKEAFTVQNKRAWRSLQACHNWFVESPFTTNPKEYRRSKLFSRFSNQRKTEQNKQQTKDENGNALTANDFAAQQEKEIKAEPTGSNEKQNTESPSDSSSSNIPFYTINRRKKRKLGLMFTRT